MLPLNSSSQIAFNTTNNMPGESSTVDQTAVAMQRTLSLTQPAAESSPRQPEGEAVGRIIEVLLTFSTEDECKSYLRNQSDEARVAIKKRIEALKTAPAPVLLPPPPPPGRRERAESVDREGNFLTRMLSGGLKSPERASSPPRNARVINAKPQQSSFSPRKDRALSPPRRQVISPRHERSESAGLKSPLRNSGNVIGEQPGDVRSSSPPRARLVEPQRLHKHELTDAQIGRLTAVFTLLEQVVTEKRNEQLLASIDANICLWNGPKIPIWSPLALNNECVIETKTLFELLAKSMAEEPLAEECLLKRLTFCLEWLKANRATTIFPKAKDLQNIANIAEQHTSEKAKEMAALMKEQLLAPQVTLQPLFKRSLTLSAHDFGGILTYLLQGTLDKSYEAEAELVSFDLFLKLRECLLAISPHDFIHKWPTIRGEALNFYTAFNNEFRNFMLDFLLRPQLKAAQRASIAKFFLYVAFKSAEFNDLTTPMIVCGLFSTQDFGALKTMKELLRNDSFDSHYLRKILQAQAPSTSVSTLGALEILERTFTPASGFRMLRGLQRALHRSHLFYIPYLAPLENFIDTMGNVSKFTQTGNFNYDKLLRIQANIEESLPGKERTLPTKINSNAIFQTNLFSSFFKDGDPEKHEPLFTYHGRLEEGERQALAIKCEEEDKKR